MEMSLTREWRGLVGMGWWLEEMRLESLRVEKTSRILWLCLWGKAGLGRPHLLLSIWSTACTLRGWSSQGPQGPHQCPLLLTQWEIHTVRTHKSMLKTQASYIIKYVEIANKPLKSSRTSQNGSCSSILCSSSTNPHCRGRFINNSQPSFQVFCLLSSYHNINIIPT